MSMLTPPGMSGKKYRITGDRYPRMRRPRRRRRIVITLIATLALIGLLGYGTLQLVDVFGGDTDGQDQAGKGAEDDACEPAEDAKPVPVPEPEEVTVNVYNATERSGLAQSTANALAERGFTIGDVDNAPEELDGQVPGTGLVQGSSLAVKVGTLAVLGAHLADAETGTVEREDATVDLVLGDAFEELAPEEDVTAALQALATVPEDDCATDEENPDTDPDTGTDREADPDAETDADQ